MKKSIVKAYVMLVMVFWLVADVTVEAAPVETPDRICAVTMARPGQVYISRTLVFIKKGKKPQLYAWIDGAKGGKVTWKSNRPNIVSVNRKTGKLTAHRVGTARITVTINGRTKSCIVVVKPW